MNKGIARAMLVVALLVLFVTLYAFLSDSLYKNEMEVLSFRSTDVSNILIGVPYLLAGAWMAFKRSRLWLWVAPGALFYTFYVYIPYVFVLEISMLFLIYILIIVLSLYTLIVILAIQNYEEVRKRFTPLTARKKAGAVLAFLGIAVALRQGSLAFVAGLSQTPAQMIDTVLWFEDLVLGAPVLLLAAYYLLRDRGVGYLVGPAILLCYASLSLGLMPYFYFESKMTGASIQWDGVIVILGMVFLCLIPFIYSVRKIRNQRNTP